MFLFLKVRSSKKEKEQKPFIKPEKEFGRFLDESDSLAVALTLTEFKTWKALLERTEAIVCNDSLPKITLENDSVIKHIYLRNPCWEGVGCILIKQRNKERSLGGKGLTS